FVHEVEILVGLSHENVVRLIGFIEQLEQGEAWIVLSWHPNGNVRDFLPAGDWEILERISLIKDTFEGLTYLHSRKPPICHGDLKSLNILVSPSYRAIITDFGSAPTIQARATGNHLTLTGPAWSLRWASPEVLFGDNPNLPSDIWSAGWICWEIMTDQVPFSKLNTDGGIIATVVGKELPSTSEDAHLSQITWLCSLMTDCWKFDPKGRPSIAHC
ncbi:hypothetical protein M407DRAFT_53601, partial [Tulasnella calospora MUT 4182]